jgi:integrase
MYRCADCKSGLTLAFPPTLQMSASREVLGPAFAARTMQYARLVQEWVACIGLDLAKFDTHSLRRTSTVHNYRRTGNLRVVQLLLGHSKIESTVRYLCIEVDDAIEIAEKIDI